MGGYALWYHKLGWPVIAVQYPIFLSDGNVACSCSLGSECREKSRGKHPVNAGWQALERFAREEFEIRAEWRLNPFANIGVPTGDRWGTFVIDADGLEGIQGVRDLEKRLGKLPPTPLQKTGGGGLQWFLRSGGRALSNTVSALAPKVDTRGEGGQAVVAPSLHRSGRRYAWLVLPSEVERAELPEIWREYIEAKGYEHLKPGARSPLRAQPGLGRASSVTRDQAKRLLVQMLDHPLVHWAAEYPEDVKWEAWRGIATNLAVPVLKYPDLAEFARRAFHTISEDHRSYTAREADSVFDGALKSATTHGPMTFAHMKAHGVPETVCGSGSSLIHAARCRLSIF